MLKWVLNSETYNKAGNSIFEIVNCYFSGAPAVNIKGYQNVSQSPHDQEHPFTCEWELHQDVSDIVIKDIKLSFSWLVPSSLIERLSNTYHRILLYFFLDELEDEIIGENRAQVPKVEGFYYNVMTIAVNTGKSIHDSVILFNDWFKELVHKLEIFLNIREEDKTFYLIGNFSTRAYDRFADYYENAARGPDHSKLRSIIPFHKRN